MLITIEKTFGLRCVLVLLAVILGLHSSGLAQDASGRVIGTVTDPTGAVIPKAKITITNVATGVTRDTTSQADGTYQVLAVPIGLYRVSAEAQGFRRITTAPEKLEINQALRIDVRMEVGATTETVQVEANASSIETVTATLGASVTSTQIAAAPLNGRNVLDLALFVPGVIPSSRSSGAGSFSVSGSRQDSVTYLLDGGVNNNLLSNGVVYSPNPDTVEEFKILVNNYTAEYGRTGGGIVSVVTKSGSNAFHGALYDYLRNEKMNANSFFNNANKLPKEVLKRNQFGATVGGPILLPKVNGKDRFFFFLGYQGQRLAALSTTAKITVFTPAELNGDFSLSNAGRDGPDSKVVSFLQKFPYFQGNPSLAARGIIDPNRINPVARNYIKANLIATSTTGDLLSQASRKDDHDELTQKYDFNITAADRLAVTLGSRRNPTLLPFAGANISGYPNTTSLNRYIGTVAYTKTISPTMLNEFRFTAQRSRTFQAVPAAQLPKSNELGIGIISDHSTGPTNLSFASGMAAGFSVQGPTALIDNTYTWSDTFTWARGRHNMKAGFFYTPYQNNTVYDFYINGTFYFYGTGGGSFSQNDRADFLMGLPDEYLQFPEAPSDIRSHNLGLFYQDEWKVRRNLTLTLGMRYEYSSPKVDTRGRSFSLGFGRQSSVFTKAPRGLLFPGDAGAPVGSNFPDRNDWSPRFGFAWDPKGNGKTAIRGGFGMFYDILKGEDNLQFNGQAPFFGFADLFFDELKSNPARDLNYMSQPFVATGDPNPFPSKPPAKDLDFAAAGFLPVGGGGVYFVDPNLRTPYVYQYNLSVQQDVGGKMRLEVAYAGSNSHKLTGLYDSNPFALGTTQRVFTTQPTVPSNGFSYLDTFSNVGNASYNGLLLGLTKRPSDVRYLGNLAFQVSYTYGKSIDTTSGFRSSNSRVPYYNRKIFRAVSDYDLPHWFSLSAVWELPFQNMWNRGPRRLTRGWQLFPNVSYRAGQTLDVLSGISRTRTRLGPSAAGDPNLVRSDLVKAVTFYDPHQVQRAGNNRTGNFFFDPTAFSSARFNSTAYDTQARLNAELRTYGTLGRNAFRGPDRTNFDLTIEKITTLNTSDTHPLKVAFIANFFNLFNTAQFQNPTTGINSGTFGQISSTFDPRIIQLAMRFEF